MRVLILLTLVFCSAWAFYDDIEFDQEWSAFKNKYNKKYDSKEEDQLRSEIYSTNKLIIYEHNRLFAAGKTAFRMGVNQFADLTNLQYRKIMNDPSVVNANYSDTFVDINENFTMTSLPFEDKAKKSIPDFKDWRQVGAVTSVKNQGLCGSCWAFAAVGCLEAQHFLRTGELIEFSAQNLIDCSFAYYNRGCDGGNALYAYNYIMANGGLNTEKNYPYEGVTGPCRYSKRDSYLPLKGFGEMLDNEENLRQAVALIGPVVVSMDISLDSFRFYKSGILNDPKCGSENLGHSALVVGYGTDQNGMDYWLIKNSFGVEWGDNGYIKIARNQNNICGVASEFSFVFN